MALVVGVGQEHGGLTPALPRPWPGRSWHSVAAQSMSFILCPTSIFPQRPQHCNGCTLWVSCIET